MKIINIKDVTIEHSILSEFYNKYGLSASYIPQADENSWLCFCGEEYDIHTLRCKKCGSTLDDVRKFSFDELKSIAHLREEKKKQDFVVSQYNRVQKYLNTKDPSQIKHVLDILYTIEDSGYENTKDLIAMFEERLDKAASKSKRFMIYAAILIAAAVILSVVLLIT